MATFHWVSDSGGDWSTAANWLNQNGMPGVPGPDDDAVVSVAGITVTTSGSISVNSLTLASGSTLDVTSGSFSVANSNAASTQLGTLDLASGTTFQVQAGTAELTSGGTIAGDLSIASGATLQNAGTTAFSAGGNIAGPGTFDNLSGGAVNFNSSANLFLAVPGTMTNAGTMTVDPGTGTVADYATTFDNTGSLTIASGALAILASGTSTGSFDAAAGAQVQFSGDLTANTPYVLAAGAVLSGAGQYQVDAEFMYLEIDTDVSVASLTLSAGTIQGTGGVTVTNAFDWTGGYFSGSGTLSIPTAATLSLDSATTVVLTGWTIDNSGNATVASGTVLNGTGTLNNMSNGLLTLEGNTTFLNAGPGTLNNAGTMAISAGTGTVSIDAATFNNTGSVTVASGALALLSSGTSSGSFDVAAGAFFQLSGDLTTNTPYVFASGAVLSGAGQYQVDAEFMYLEIDTDVSVASLTLSAGTIQGTGGVTVTNAFDWTGGDFSGSGTLSIPSVATLSLDSATTVVLTGWTIDNSGSATVASGTTLNGSGTFNNMSNGLLTLEGNTTFLNAGPGTLNNSGTVAISAGTGTTTIRATTFNNTGSVTVASGALAILSSGTSSGFFDVASGAQLQFSGDLTANTPYILAPGAVLSGAGQYEVDAEFMYLEIDTGVSVASLSVSDGDITGTGSLTVTGALNWSGGAFYGTWTLMIDQAATLSIDPTSSVGLGIAMDNAGIVTWSSGAFNLLYVAYAGEFNNYGTFDIGDVTSNALNVGQMNNYGTLAKTAGSGTTLFGPPLFNSGTVEVDSGTLEFADDLSNPIAQLSGTTLTGGTWNVAGGAALAFPSGSIITTNQASITLAGPGASFSALAGLATNSGSLTLTGGATFTTAGPLANNGTITVGPSSVLSVTGAYSQSAAATLSVTLGGPSSSGQFGQLQSTGPATLDGTLDLSLAAGFAPTAGDTYSILTYPSATGTFAAIDRLSSGAGQYLNASVNPTSVTIVSTVNASDLAVGSVLVPTITETPGQPESITFQVNNLSATATPQNVPSWTDSVYLSLSPTFDNTAVLLGRVTHQGTLAGNSSYTDTVNDPLPGLAPGSYHVFAVADSRELLPDPNRANNTGVASTLLTVGYPTLSLGQEVTGTISSGQNAYYELTLPAGSATRIMAGSTVAGGVSLYVGYLSVPTSSTFDESSAQPTSLAQSVLLPGTQAGEYYILVQGSSALTSAQPFTLEAQSLPLEVLSVSTASGANVGTTTLTVSGSMFTAGTTLKLIPQAGGPAITASSVTQEDSSTLFASFNLAGTNVGTYNIEAINGSQTATDPEAFAVTTGTPGQLSVTMSEPNAIRPGRTGTVIVDYSNSGGSDIPAPLFVLTATNASLELTGSVMPAGATLDFLGVNPTGPAGVLPPGASGTAVIDFTPTSLMSGENSGGLIQFNLGDVPEDSTAMDWSSQESALQPSNIPASAWGAVFTNFVASVGSTTGQYVAALDADATYLSQLGEPTDDVSRLVAFEIQKANAFYAAATLATVTDASYPTPGAIPLDFVRQFNQSIGGRNQSGPLGDGWTDNWQISAAADAQGNVTIADDGSTAYFTLQPDGSYMSMPDDHDTLTLVNGAYQLRATDGTLTAFSPNGSLAYIEDANGNRVTTTFNAAGQLTVLTASDGSALTIAYNAHGLISQVTDPAGQTTTYSYDASGQHLIAYTDMYGTTQYTYLTGPTAADANALASIAYADDTHVYYSYDAQGRLTGTSRDGGAEALIYSYGSVGGYTITDADHNATTILQDDMGLIVQTTDPLGNITRYAYDADSDLTEILAPDGTTTTFTYDSQGNLTSETDALGNVTRFTYDPIFSQLLSSTDPRGDTTTYGIDADGNVTSVTAPDGSVQQYTYNSLGEVVEWTNANLQSTLYTYDNNGELTNELFPDGTSNSYTYDDRGNLLTATGAGGDYSFVYNSINLPTQITELTGALTYSYNVVGQTTQMVETTGSSTFTVNYLYDALGRLEQLTGANGNNIDTYSYDAAGNLIGEAKGNGTSTSYEYDADGDLLRLTNLAPNGTTVNSSFAYTYDALGRVTSMTTGGVTTDYGYDADGELTSAAAPGESIQYAYDPSGNLTSVTDNGTMTPYTANSVNEYTAVGGTTYGYDADGNMTSSITGGVTTSYTFNSQNQLTAVHSPTGTFAYTYDPFGNQISSSVNGTVTNNLINPEIPGTILAQTNGSGALLAAYTYGLGLVSRVDPSGAAAYYDYNNIGSTVGITNSSGTYVNQYSYSQFGQATTISAGIANPFTFVGRYGVTADSSGLLHMQARDYDPVTGQFVSDDPLGLRGGDINFRRYVGNDPIDLIDPSGLESEISGGPTPPPRAPSLPLGAPDEPDGPFDELPPTPPPPLVFLIPIDGGFTLIVIAADPNDITGPSGFGAGGFITPEETLPYTIDFENLPTATAPAQTVTVTQQLSPNLDWSTFQLGAIDFGSTVVNVPAGRTSYTTTIDATATLGLLVDVTAGINLSTGLVTWTFTSLDPTTLDLTSNPLAGFLPPDNTPPEGEGSVSYTIMPKTNLASDSVVSAQATVVFDTNAPINTPTLVNTLDVARPTSSVNPLPSTSASTTFTVSWAGSDPAGPGIAAYNVFVSEDGGPFQPLLLDTAQNSTTFTGQLGHTYGFLSVATDSLGLVQTTPSAAQTSISLVLPPPPVVIAQIQLVENRHHLVTQIVITFSGAVNAAEAATTAPFHLATPGKRGSFTAKNAGTIKLKSAAYNSATGKVTLTPRKAFALSKPVQLRVYAELPFGLEDSLDRFINGGTDALSILTKREVTKGAAAARAPRQVRPFRPAPLVAPRLGLR